MDKFIGALVVLHHCLTVPPPPRRGERGSVTTEHVLWAVAVIMIVGIVVAAVQTYVTTQAGNIN